MEDVIEICRFVFVRYLATLGAQGALRPAVEQALDGIEAICAAALHKTPGWVPSADTLAFQKLLVLAATPDGHFVFGKAEKTWRKPPRDLVRVSGSELWAGVVRGVQQRNPDDVVDYFATRCPRRKLAQLRLEATRFRRLGFVPLLVILCAANERRACGLSFVIPRPELIETNGRPPVVH